MYLLQSLSSCTVSRFTYNSFIVNLHFGDSFKKGYLHNFRAQSLFLKKPHCNTVNHSRLLVSLRGLFSLCCQLRSFLFTFSRFNLVSFELWGLGLNFFYLRSLPIQRLNRKIWFKLGFSHKIIFDETPFIRLVAQRRLSDFRRRKFFLLSSDILILRHFCVLFRYLKGLNTYKYRGIKFAKEEVFFKSGKSGKV